MSVLWSKDATTRLEDVRFFVGNDKLYHSIDNKPLWDLEQRDLDLDRFNRPARGLRVRQSLPADSLVDVEEGWYIATDGVTVTKYAGAVGIVINATSAANRFRFDLIYFSLATGTYGRVSGSETLGGFPATFPAIPANRSVIPLAILYVDNSLTSFNESISPGLPGAILDVRPALGANKWLFETNSANILADGAVSVGTLYTVARANHVHALNSSAGTAPETLDLNKSATGSAGGGTLYSIVDHVHDLDMTALASHTKDGTKAIGTSNKLVRGDHYHDLNVDASGPERVGEYGAVPGPGVMTAYSRHDHSHRIPDWSIALYKSFIDTTTTISIPAGTTFTDISFPTNIVVPANTFPNGIIVEWEIGYHPLDDSVGLVQEKIVNFGSSRSAAFRLDLATGVGWNVVGSTKVTLDGAYLGLGYKPGACGNYATSGASGYLKLHNYSFRWNKTGILGDRGSMVGYNAGGLHPGDDGWTPTASTSVNLHRFYSVGDGGNMVYRQLSVYGF
jgi:hypothetical protein